MGIAVAVSVACIGTVIEILWVSFGISISTPLLNALESTGNWKAKVVGASSLWSCNVGDRSIGAIGTIGEGAIGIRVATIAVKVWVSLSCDSSDQSEKSDKGLHVCSC